MEVTATALPHSTVCGLPLPLDKGLYGNGHESRLMGIHHTIDLVGTMTS
jgi:hypothetical protein